MANAQQKPKNKPVAHVRVNLVQASIFENRTDKGVFYNITTDRSYKDQNSEWKRTHSFDLQSLPALEKAVQLAFLKIHALKAQDEADADQGEDFDPAANADYEEADIAA